MKKIALLLMPLLLIIVMSSSMVSNSEAAEPEYKPFVAKPGTQTETVYIHELRSDKSGVHAVVDPIEWYEGEAAQKAFVKYEPDADIDGPLDGYYIVNPDDTLVTYPVAANAEVLMQIYDRGGMDSDISWNEPVSLEKFIHIFGQSDLFDLSYFPYHITIEKGQITSIVQQYIP
ncbi:hypothetical protein RE628_27385 [Paenibacillus sp. D2_2]|uniref:hypothetical protein n=1 Tax=Paenibacillus sp. D2_2 TaxID=3073092 RepID=UPI0028168273|nr:hypothetical protein [Paenibacillus sp. D2_2]WMT40784.1 hypothetical protein RE628_27385 [Paenibacillus sp. D2_2]